MAERFVICQWDFLGAGDRQALETTAQQITGKPPLLLDMNRLADQPRAQAQQTMQDLAQELRAQAGSDQITLLSSGINYLHPLAHQLKEKLQARWLDIRLDVDNDHGFKNYPKDPDPYQPVDCAIGLRSINPGGLGSMIAKFFNRASAVPRLEISTVPVIPDQEKIAAQKEHFTKAHPDMGENALVVLLGSYMQGNTLKAIDKIVAQAQEQNRPVIFVTSPRTEKQQEKIATQLAQKYGDQPGIYVHRFDAKNPAGNIYPGVLGCASDVAVTSDSLTMVSESIALGLRTHILPTMAERPAYYQALDDKNLVRMVKDKLDTSWTPGPRPDPFAEIKAARAIMIASPGTPAPERPIQVAPPQQWQLNPQ